MTAVVGTPTFPQITRSAWGSVSGSNPMDSDEVRGMFAPRKQLSRTNSASSLASNSSNTSVATNGTQSNGTPLSAASDASQWSASTVPRKRSQPKAHWPPIKSDVQFDYPRVPLNRPNGMAAPHNAVQPGHGPNQMVQSQQMIRSHNGGEPFPPGQPVLYLLSLNGTFERKTIAVPFAPESVRIGRQTNQKTVPTATNGFFDSKVLSRQHAEIYAERNGKVYIRDVKSSNGTFVNGTRLSQENRESEPHELQTADHLELGIDIVSEDQKTVVHHKVAAKVEHAGFLSSTNNVLDMNFGDLDPANGTMMMPNGPLHTRGRLNMNMGHAGNRMLANNPALNGQMNNMSQQRSYFLAPIATDQILKRLASEMRNARLQAQDLGRTHQFVNTLLSKDNVKDLEKSQLADPAKLHQQQASLNGGFSFRSDPKVRFSEPPAPPPQQPLPEKPDVPSLKRGPTERPKLGSQNFAAARPENMSQIMQLTEALNNAKRDIDTQSVRMRELEEMLRKEREARELAEDLAKRLEASAIVQMNGADEPESDVHSGLIGIKSSMNTKSIAPPVLGRHILKEHEDRTDDSTAREMTTSLQTRLESMDAQLTDMREQLEQWKQRCRSAEMDRDESRKSLAETVFQLRVKEAKRVAAGERRRSPPRRARAGVALNATEEDDNHSMSSSEGDAVDRATMDNTHARDDLDDEITLSRANTITALSSQGVLASRDHALRAGLPYASMLGVVLIGMGLMAYINGWQSPSPRVER